MIRGKPRKREGVKERKGVSRPNLGRDPHTARHWAVPLDSTPSCPPPWRPTSRLRPLAFVRSLSYRYFHFTRQKPRDELPNIESTCCSSSVRPLYQRAPIRRFFRQANAQRRGLGIASAGFFGIHPPPLVSSLVLYLLFTSY
ncbi:hypothetical protein NL676_012959 [Syzygium grande]|nr:hypothetical protein NL676_012959 [Syzygium grande]